MRSWRSPPWGRGALSLSSEDSQEVGELACRLRGAAPSLAKELQGGGRGRGKGKEERVGALGALPLGRRCFADN